MTASAAAQKAHGVPIALEAFCATMDPALEGSPPPDETARMEMNEGEQ
jgi:hypothetical protein